MKDISQQIAANPSSRRLKRALIAKAERGPRIDNSNVMWRRSVHLKISECLGEGQQGSVFKALRIDPQTDLRQIVAVKILHSETAVELWQREFESLSRIRSPYCVQALAFDRLGGRPTLVLEYVDGISLTRLVRANRLKESLIEEILAQLEHALRDLHARELFHGDLSPGNVLIDRQGRTRLLDFGLANSHANLMRLTPEFAAPERLAGGPATWAADLFSVGRLEQFMKGSSLTHLETNDYLHLSPQKRQTRGHKPETNRQQELGTLVAEIQDLDRIANAFRTQTQIQPKRTTLPRTLIAGLSFLFISISSSASFPHKIPETAHLNVRTKLWHRFTINGRDIGYAPLEISVPAETELRVVWTNPRGHGSKCVSLHPGQTLWLEDRDFSH